MEFNLNQFWCFKFIIRQTVDEIFQYYVRRFVGKRRIVEHYSNTVLLPPHKLGYTTVLLQKLISKIFRQRVEDIKHFNTEMYLK